MLTELTLKSGEGKKTSFEPPYPAVHKLILNTMTGLV